MDQLEHWLLKSLKTFKNTGSDDKIKAIRTFIEDVEVLEDDNEMLSSLEATKINLVVGGFYAVIDINMNLHALQIGCHPFPKMLKFSTVGSDPSLDIVVLWDDVLLVSKQPLSVTQEDMFNRYDKQLIQVYHSAPKQVIQDETDPLTEMITRSLMYRK